MGNIELDEKSEIENSDDDWCVEPPIDFNEMKHVIYAMIDLINSFTHSGFVLEDSGDGRGEIWVMGGDEAGVKEGVAAIDFISGALAARKKYLNMGFETHVDLLITRHPSYTEYLRMLGFSWDREVAHAHPESLNEKTVLTSGMPMHLAKRCRRIITVPLDIPPELRGQELTFEHIRLYAQDPQWFKVLGGSFPKQDLS